MSFIKVVNVILIVCSLSSAQNPQKKSDPSGTKFTCQHGPRECEGNKILSCAQNAYPDQTLQVEYTNCFMKNYKNKQSAGPDCASQVGLDYNIISQCATSQEGTQLQLEKEKMTKKYKPSFIPTIVYDGVFDQEKQDESLTDFIDVVRSLL